MVRKGILGIKLGMTQVFTDDNQVVPVTVLRAGPCPVTQVRTVERDGYRALQLGYGRAKRANKPLAGHFAAAGVEPTRYLVEIAFDDDHQVGDVITVDIFRPGELVDVTARSKGKGFAGVMKRHGLAPPPRTSERLLVLAVPARAAASCAVTTWCIAGTLIGASKIAASSSTVSPAEPSGLRTSSRTAITHRLPR